MPVDDEAGVAASLRIDDDETRVIVRGRTVVLGEVVEGLVVERLVVEEVAVDETASCAEIDGPLAAPSVATGGVSVALSAVRGEALLLDDAVPAEPSAPVSSAWARPDPVVRAAPTPRVIAPAPSQP